MADAGRRFVSVLKYLGLGLGGLIVVAVVGLLIAQRVSDGPMMGFIQGGPFKTGEWVETPVRDWSFAANNCDLGYLWNRLEGASTSVLRLIYIFKT